MFIILVFFTRCFCSIST